MTLIFWNVQAPVAPGQSVARSENGVEAENTSVIKNWRHTVGPAQLGSPQDDGVQTQFTHTHTRTGLRVVSHIQGVSAGFNWML